MTKSLNASRRRTRWQKVKLSARAASHRFAPRKPSPLTNSRAKADMYKFETRARHMYLETHPAYVNREEKSEQTEKKTTKRVSTGGASPLTLLFPTRVKISPVLFLFIDSMQIFIKRTNYTWKIIFDIPTIHYIISNRGTKQVWYSCQVLKYWFFI